MQDLFQNYVDNVSKLRDAFHDELAAQAQELSKAMDIYAQRSEAALYRSWRRFRLAALRLKRRRRQNSISFAAFPQAGVCRMSMTGRSHPQMRIK